MLQFEFGLPSPTWMSWAFAQTNSLRQSMFALYMIGALLFFPE